MSQTLLRKTKNTITMGRHLKYLILFIQVSGKIKLDNSLYTSFRPKFSKKK